jgi:hypothetical protein
VKRAVALPSLALLAAVALKTAEVLADAPPEVAAPTFGVPPKLEWIRDVGAESCVGKAELDELLAQALGGRAGPSALGRSSIEGLVSRGRAPQTWRARVRIISAEGKILGQREFSTSEDACSAITPSVLLVLLILIDPEAAERGVPSELLRSIQPRPVPTRQATTPSVEPHAESDPRRRLSWLLHVEPVASVGLLSEPALGLTGGVSLVTRDGWQLALSGGYAGKTKIGLEPNAYVIGGNVLVSGLLVDLSVCPSLAERFGLRLSACLGATLVTRFFETPGLAEHSDPARSSLGPSTSIQASLPLSESWQFRASLAATLLLPREHFGYADGSNAVHRIYTPSRFFGSVGFGLATTL